MRKEIDGNEATNEISSLKAVPWTGVIFAGGSALFMLIGLVLAAIGCSTFGDCCQKGVQQDWKVGRRVVD